MQKIIIFLSLFGYCSVTAQFGPPQQIANNIEWTSALNTADLNGDGFVDVLSGSSLDHEIVWYENLDGSGNFGNPNLISDLASGVESIFSVDIDNDGDMDIVAALNDSNSIVWIENLDGLGNFGAMNIINNNALSARLVKAGDFNNDGFYDILFASHENNKISWHENNSGTGQFGPEQIVSDNAIFPSGLFNGDIDQDGDIDIISASLHGNRVAWYENLDGLGTFGTPNIVSDQYSPTSVHASDLDGDGDLEILYTLSQVIGWHENLDNLGNYGPRQDIGYGIHSIDEVTTADIDNDNDQDVLAIGGVDDIIVWFENIDGQGNFGTAQIIANNICSNDIIVNDINGDYKTDLIASNNCTDSI